MFYKDNTLFNLSDSVFEKLDLKELNASHKDEYKWNLQLLTGWSRGEVSQIKHAEKQLICRTHDEENNLKQQQTHNTHVYEQLQNKSEF